MVGKWLINGDFWLIHGELKANYWLMMNFDRWFIWPDAGWMMVVE